MKTLALTSILILSLSLIGCSQESEPPVTEQDQPAVASHAGYDSGFYQDKGLSDCNRFEFQVINGKKYRIPIFCTNKPWREEDWSKPQERNDEKKQELPQQFKSVKVIDTNV